MKHTNKTADRQSTKGNCHLGISIFMRVAVKHYHLASKWQWVYLHRRAIAASMDSTSIYSAAQVLFVLLKEVLH